MARMYRNPADKVLHYIAISSGVETIEAEDIWGGVHRAVGRLTHRDLTSRYAHFLAEAGVGVDAFPDGVYWIVDQDCEGFVCSTSYADEGAYERTLREYIRRWEESCRSLEKSERHH